MFRETCIMLALSLAASQDSPVYVMRRPDGELAVRVFCDVDPRAVVAIVGPSGIVWTAPVSFGASYEELVAGKVG